jgi:gliding motility-associated-like protein
VYYIKGTTAAGCSAVSAVNVVINPPINAPNVFSPNNDGVHDSWTIPALQLYPACRVEVFDRYGHSIFQSTGYTKNWDGKDLSGRPIPQGVYYYVIKLSNVISAIGGSVTVLR